MPDALLHADPEEKETLALVRAFSSFSLGGRDFLARIVDLLPCYVVLVSDDYRILFRNKAFDQYFGPPGDKSCYQALRGQDAPCRFCAPLGSINHHSFSVIEWAHPGSKHAFRVYSYPFGDVDGSPCVLKTGFNVTSKLRVQRALDLSEQSYRIITDNLSIGIALLDTRLRIKTGNIRMSQWFAEGFKLNISICGVLGCPNFSGARSASPPCDASACESCPICASSKDGNSHEKEFTVLFQDGREHVVRLVTCPVSLGKNAGGGRAVRALIVMLEDITTRLYMSQQLQRARKLEAMNALAGGIAHEINQPLSALHLYASGLQMLLEEQGDLSTRTTLQRLTLIMNEAEKIRSIIDHMRALVLRDSNVCIGPAALDAAVDMALSVMGRQIDTRGIQVIRDMPDPLPLVHSNDVQLQQVVVNLLSNAIHALDSMVQEKGGTFVPRILLKATLDEAGQKVRLEVADNGAGLPKGSEHIFDPFFTTKEKHQGMGLGLSIAHAMISLWGGEISAVSHHSELGGASFLVDLHVAVLERSALP
jgi:signal transduction histidine kinase